MGEASKNKQTGNTLQRNNSTSRSNWNGVWGEAKLNTS